MKNEPTMNTVTETALGYFMKHKGMYSQADVEKLLATARAEGAKEERERIKQVITPKLAALESTSYEYPNSDYIKGQEDLADEMMQALTTKEHHAE